MPGDAHPVVHLARHGETPWNRAGRMQGQHDVGLAPRGVEQAEALARRVSSGSRPARLVSSDLSRARDTAAAVARATGLRLDLDPRLREQDLGLWQGLDFAQSLSRDPVLAARFRERDPDARPPGGETRAELQERVWAAFLDLAAAGTPGPLLVVTHGGVIQSLVYRVLGLPLRTPRRFRLPNVGLTTLVWHREAWCVRTLNDVTHWPGDADTTFPFD